MERSTFSCPLFFQYNDEAYLCFLLYVEREIYKKECLKTEVTKFTFLCFFGSGESKTPGARYTRTQTVMHMA